MKTNKTLSIALAVLFSSSLAVANEVSGKLVLENAGLNSGGILKNEMKIKLYVDGDITDNATYHAELQGSNGNNAYTDDGDSSNEFTQNAELRELYTDISGGDWEARIGKQQIVWGTADGMKLLDIINPTDYAEMAQDQMEDSRIPVWAINLERGSVQAVISQPKENVFAGLNRGTKTHVRMNGIAPSNMGEVMADGFMSASEMSQDIVDPGTDAGNAFLMMGPDTITGATDGFLNIVPDLGSVASGFGGAFMPLGSTPESLGGLANPLMNDLMSAFTVDAFTVARNEDGINGTADDMTAMLGLDGIEKARTLNELSTQFKGMQVGKTMAMWSAGGDDYNPATTGDNPNFGDAADADNNGTPDVWDNFNAVYGAAAAGAMGFDALNFSASVVGMACANPAMGDMGGQLLCTESPYNKATPDAQGVLTWYKSDDTLTTAADIAAYTADVATDYAVTINLDPAMGVPGNQATLGDLFDGEGTLNGFGAMYGSNLSTFGDGDANSAFEYMTGTGFRTFDTFVNARSQYVYNMPKSDDVDFAIKTSQTTKSGVNYSLNFSNSYDKNPIINLKWKNDAGEELSQEIVSAPLTMIMGPDANGDMQLDANGAPLTMTIPGSFIELTDAANNVYGGATGASAILEFEQAVVRTKNLGASFDTSVEMAGLGPVVIRGEALYTMDGKQPVMSKTQLSAGDLVGALSMQDANRFKFVLGADVTVLTNMLVSGQYISDRNLDFIDSTTEYTTDYATMHLSNGFNKAIEDKQYYSLFFSKPFGESGQHRWNNITMVEEGVGENAFWNRLDVSYGLADDVEGTVEFNNYWGNANTQFGQLKEASNMQVGVKYSF